MINFQSLVETFNKTHRTLQNKAKKAINQTLTVRNWLFGFYIVEFEQKGADRADYGEKLLRELSKELKKQKLTSTSFTNLKFYRQFYKNYPSIGTFIAEHADAQSLGIKEVIAQK